MPDPFESRLIPIMREGIDIIRMILYRKLKENLAARHPDRDGAFVGRLSGTLVNKIFGVENQEAPFLAFVAVHASLISQELARVASDLGELRIPLTDALRMQALCDHQEGLDSTSPLREAEKLGILLLDRDLPLPHSFIQLARSLGRGFGLVTPPSAAEKPETP